MKQAYQRLFATALLTAMCSVGMVAWVQGDVLIKEVVSREFSIHAGGIQSPEVKVLASREFSISVENGRGDYPELVSRMHSLVVSDDAAPPQIAELTVDVSATGDAATLDWSGYNQWAVGDIDHFEIYFTDAGGFTDVSGMTPYRTVSGESTSVTLTGLNTFTDHFFAIVAVDALGHSDPQVQYSAAYVITPEIVSREVSFHIATETVPSYANLLSREYSLVVSGADPPPPIDADLAVTVSPTGDSVTLNWSAYNQWEVGDVDHFDIYLSDSGGFSDVSGMTPIATAVGGGTTITLDGLTPFTDHFLAVVPVDALGHFGATVAYSAAYVITPELVSREVSIQVANETAPAYGELVSREFTLLVPTPEIPAPVTGGGSGFFVETSDSDFGAVDLSWPDYDELAQVDVVAYRIYVADSFFEDVTGLTPFAEISSGVKAFSLSGLDGSRTYHFAVVAVDALDQSNPAVRSFSAQTSISGVGEVENLVATSGVTSISYSWEAPLDSEGFLLAYRIYFAGATEPIELSSGVTSWQATGLDSATGYPFRITTVDLSNTESDGRSLIGSTLLPNPAGVSLTLRGGDVIMFWDPVEPSSLVGHYQIYQSATEFSDVGDATPITTSLTTEVNLGPLTGEGGVDGLHFAVATVNTLGGSEPAVSSVEVSKQEQTITFPEPSVVGSAPIPLTASASSGLDVRFELDSPLVAEIDTSGTTPQLVAHQGGRVTVAARQDGDGDFWPAGSVEHLLRLPPLINTFTANGAEILDGSQLGDIDEVLRVTALDTDGIAKAEFFIRPVGGVFTSLGVDATPGDGLSAVFALDAYADGAYDLKVVVYTPELITGETVRSVTLQLGSPPPPQITAPLAGAQFDQKQITVSGTTVRDTEVYLLRNGVDIAGPLTPDASGVFTANITLIPGDNVLSSRATNRAGSSASSPVRLVTLRSFLTLGMTPASLTEGATSLLTITRNHDQGAVQVSFSDNHPGQLTLPAPITIPDGSTEVSVSVSAVDDAVAEMDQGVVVTALANDYHSSSNTLTVLDNDRPTLTISLNRSTISEGAGPGELQATFTRSPVTDTPFVVEIHTSDPASLQVSTTAAFGSFVGSITVPINTIDNPETDGDRDVNVFGRILDVTSGDPLAESNDATITVTDNDGPSLMLKIDRAAVAEGASVRARLIRNTGEGTPLTVALSVDDTSEASLPSSITFLASQTELFFDIDGLNDAESDGNQSVLVHASATGFSPAEAALIVSDLQRPDIAVSRTIVPHSGLTDDSLSYSYRVENQGPEDNTKPITIRVLLSTDSLVGDDELIEEYVFRSALPSGLYFERSGSFFTPRKAGTYYLLVVADYEQIVTEVIETNNLGVSDPIEIGAAYRASVSTTTTVAPGGTPIEMTGTATNNEDDSPAAFKLVSVHVMVRGTERVLSAMTNSNGDFALTFTPLPGEGGSYTIGATHPGISQAEDQDAFTLLGFTSSPKKIEATVTRNGDAIAGSVTVRNLADLPMNNLQVSVTQLAAGYTAVTTIHDNLTVVPELGEFTIDYEISASALASATSLGVLHVTSNEGAVLDIPFDLIARDLTSRLAWDGGKLEAGMSPGSRSFVELNVRNEGSSSTGPIQVILPVSDWLSCASATPLPSLEPGESASISLQLDPPAGMPLTVYSGALQIRGDDNVLTIPFSLRALSTATTNVTVLCEDEYTYFAASKPPLEGAIVTLVNVLDNSVEASGVSGPDGKITFNDIPEGYYRVKVTATKHGGYQETVLVKAGVDTLVRTFLTRQTVEYIWNVVPTKIEDHYKIVLETVFETNVPIPVVTIEPAHVDLDSLTEDVTQINFTLTNHGLINADDLFLRFRSTEDWEITPLTEDLGTLSAKSSVTVPVTIRRLNSGSRSSGCGPGGGGVWSFVCGDHSVGGSASTSFTGGGSSCGISWGGGSAGGGVSMSSAAISSSGGIACSTCVVDTLKKCAEDYLKGQVLGLIPGLGCIYSIATTDIENTVDVIQTALGCSGMIGAPLSCFIDVIQCIQNEQGRSSPLYSEALERFERHGRGVLAMQDFHVAVFGDEAWRELLDDPDITAFRELAQSSVAGNTRSEQQITASERADLLATPFGAAHATLVNQYCDRLNRTIDYGERGIYEVNQVPSGESTDFLTKSSVENASVAVEAAYDAARAEGFDNPVDAFYAAADDLFIASTQGDGVCAKVKLQIEQEAVMTRDAFDASLVLNNSATHSIEGVEVSLRVKDAFGGDATSLFGVTPPTITGVSGGAVGPESSGSWQWTIIPTQDAAPTEATVYFVEGKLSYTVEGEPITVPLIPHRITVYPNPRLIVKYFHQRDVFSDDPHTDIVEPSIPFSLGVMIENRGAGVAQNLRITSGQPEIVDNEKGLLIHFEIIATEVAGKNLSPGLTADFGDLAPGEIKVGRWLMTSTLQGLFIDYSAKFEHVDNLGDERLSLIESVEIHETVHQIQALGANDDGLPDFLVNDVPDAFSFPDTIHLSDGTTVPVAMLDEASVPAPEIGQLSVSLTVPNMGAGWTYLRIPDPGDGAFRLVSVTRSDGREIPLDVNVWTTDRTFVGQGQVPIRENILHLVDSDSTGAYTLNYVVVPLPDTTAPTSSIAALPDDSGEFFELAWTGNDDTGVVAYDIYVSTDGGPFTLWLENTSDQQALFEGELGSSYSFFSIAHDAAGNDESGKTEGEASTTTSIVNQAPVLDAIANVSITEGQTVHVQVVASDPDGPDSQLRYAVEASDPGLVIDPVTGALRWITTESDGGTSLTATVTVTDGSSTPLTDSQTFTIVVESSNARPHLADPDSEVVDVGEALSVQLTATDSDIPSQLLTYRFVDTPPAGMTLDPATGLVEWTPLDEHESQTFEVEIEVFDDEAPAGVDSTILRIEVLEKPGLPPVFDEVLSLVWTEGASCSYAFHAFDPEGQPVTMSADISGLPGWVETRTGQDGVITLFWNTSGVPAGSYELTLTASTTRQETVISQAIQIVSRAAHNSYTEWVDSYDLVGWDALDSSDPTHHGLNNLLIYALGVDPLMGISPAQPDPLPRVVFSGGPALRFLMPIHGRVDLNYIVQYSQDLSEGSWSTIAQKQSDGEWSGTATVTTEDAQDGYVWVCVTPTEPSTGLGFMRLGVDRLPDTTTGFGVWPGPVGDTLATRAFSDANGDGYANILAYAFGASSANTQLAGEGIVLPSTEFTPDGVTLSMHFATPPQSDVIYIVETSSDLSRWTQLGWWTVDSADQSKVHFTMESTGDGGTDFHASWGDDVGAGDFSRVRISYR